VTVVVDSSVMVAALLDSSAVGVWAESLLDSDPLAAPHLMPVEAANILRRSALAGDISEDVASLAHTDLVSRRLELFPYDPCAARAWQLRANITSYDAWYVALAEALGATLATLDARLARATGPTCRFAVPPG
jgi:predicted nucleic acid-binding protein